MGTDPQLLSSNANKRTNSKFLLIGYWYLVINNSLRMSYDAFGGRQGGIALVEGCDHGTGQSRECHARHRILHHHRHAIVATLANTRHQRNLAQQTHIEFLGQVLAAVFPKDVVLLVGVCGRREPRHILHNAQHRHIHMLTQEHAHALAGIGQRHLLWCGHHYGTRDGKRLHQREVNVARARRHINDEVVEFAPVGIVDKLFQGIARHCAAPQHGFILIDHKAYREHLHAIFLSRHNQVAAVHFTHIELLVFQTQHLGHRGAENVGVEQTHAVALHGKRHGQVHRHGRLPYSAFARRNAYDVLHARQRHLRFLLGLESHGSDVSLDFHFFAHIGVHGHFGGTHHRFDEGVGGFLEYDRERNLVAVDAHIVGHHAHFHDILAGTGITHMLQSFDDKFRI
uniref:ATPase n=1 Tax=uncultured bacterium 34R1 TaxID=581113 RepID=C0K046_9BACT|nr:ATPase [uncultured bacterium 34R1]